MEQMVFIEYTRVVTIIARFVFNHALALGLADGMGWDNIMTGRRMIE